MKRINSTIIIALAAVAMLATGCKKEQTGKTVTLGASIASNNTKVYIDEYTPKWQSGDLVNVNGMAYGVSNINGGSADITGVAVANDFRCVYPSSIVTSGLSAGSSTCNVNLPTTQTYAVVEVDEREYQTVAVPMSGATSGSTVTFHNLCSVLKVKFSNNTGSSQTLKKIRVTAATSYLSGTGTAQVTGGATDKVELSSGKKYVDLDMSGNMQTVAHGASQDFYIVLPEFSRQDVTIEFVKSDNMAASISLINVALGHNKLVSKTCSVNSGGFNVRFMPSGEFTVNSSGGKVRFSPGNLQYYGPNNLSYNWRFAENQYDYPETWNTSSWVDLFRWGQWTGSSPTPLNSSSPFIWDDDDFQGTIEGAPGPWRTLTNDEWDYLLNRRTTTTSGVRYVFAMVDNKKGLVILPDDWSSDYWDFSTNNGEIGPDEEWNSLEAHGAVFLPAAGNLLLSGVIARNVYGSYWSSSPYGDGSQYANNLDIRTNNNSLEATSHSTRNVGMSVRLVQDI